MAEIVITIKPTGEAHVEADGYQGPSCSLATKPFVDALGKRSGELPKPEMFLETTQQQQVTQ